MCGRIDSTRFENDTVYSVLTGYLDKKKNPRYTVNKDGLEHDVLFYLRLLFELNPYSNAPIASDCLD